jgi:hypothetical protein
MKDQEIIDNAPEGEDDYFFDITGEYFDEHGNHLDSKGAWSPHNIGPISPRSLADIKRIVELEKPHDEIDPLLKELLYCCDGLYCDYAQENYGDAKNWLRHIDAAYGKYRDAIDDLEALKEPKT